MNGLPIGCILCFPSEICPEAFLPCDGRELSKQAYPLLYQIVKGLWEETPKTFFLPDLQGQFVRGWDKTGNVDPDRKLGSCQEDCLQGHSHDLIEENQTSGKRIYYKSVSVKPETKDSGISVNSLVTEKERDAFKQLERESLKPTSEIGIGSYLRDFLKVTSVKLLALTHNEYNFRIPDIIIGNPTNSTYQPVRLSTETRPKNVALVYCIKVK